jgi:flagellar biosynthesis/type III secretory pathway protein FliH
MFDPKEEIVMVAEYISQRAADQFEKLVIKHDLVRGAIADFDKFLYAAFEEGRDQGYSEGYDDGHNEGYNEGYDEGYDDGHNEGYSEGHDEGYGEGWVDAKDE